MRRTIPLLMCLLLLFGMLCPAFGMQPAGAHACCHTKKSSAQSCCNSVRIQASDRIQTSVPVPALAAEYRLEVLYPPSFSLVFTSPSIYVSPPVRSQVLRI